MTEPETLPLFTLLHRDDEAVEVRHLPRVILVGDHLQLAPVVRNAAVRSATGLHISLFERLISSGVGAVWLNRQARARPATADLYRWRYRGLTDLSPATMADGAPLFERVCSFCDVPRRAAGVGLGVVGAASSLVPRGETAPEEARAIVCFLDNLARQGVDLARVSVITPYRAQKNCLQAAIQAIPYAVGAAPRDVVTVDEFQGRSCGVPPPFHRALF